MEETTNMQRFRILEKRADMLNIAMSRLADVSGVSQATVSAWRKHRFNPTEESLVKLENALTSIEEEKWKYLSERRTT